MSLPRSTAASSAALAEFCPARAASISSDQILRNWTILPRRSPREFSVGSLFLLRHIRGGCGGVVPEAAGTSLEAAGQGCRKPASHARYRVRHVAFRPGRGRRAVDNRREG